MLTCPVWFGGEWREIKDVATTPVHNPSTGEVIAEAPLCTAAHVNEAIEAAAAAFPAWMETPPVERARIFFKFKMLLDENFDDLIRCNTREHGKTLSESRGAVAADGRGPGKHRARH
jgi:malonate-semialdehyde dehydrogenase (acetylating)/methylmalonate-semialdehyde dehydrogenase